MPSSMIAKRLVVFDFDWTLIETDSDFWVIKTLGGELSNEQEAPYQTMLWTDLQELLLGKLYDRGVTRQDLERTLREIPFTPEIIAALRLMKSEGAELCILSDANTFYIDTILKAHRIDHLFSKIITNPAHFNPEHRLHVARFHGLDQAPHNCPLSCHANLCKGQELQKLIDAQIWDQVIYMGDSTNDFCPSTRLQAANDIVLARSNLLLEKSIREHLEMIKAKVLYWDSPKHAFTIVQSLFGAPGSNSTSTKAQPLSSEEQQSAIPLRTTV
ncbi:phosphatase phospho-type [Dissophora ornata]|nr:hypothetical protein BGZ58_004812 [Dissophora ornata]KAI8604971.1 phosphatase phospho-type [Dissophora ornata]